MQPVTVIKHRYVVQYILLGFIAGLVVPPMHSFLLQAAEEAFHNSVNQPTGQRKGSLANPSTGQVGLNIHR